MLLLLSHQLIATTQSLVTGRTPISLEWKITAGWKRLRTKGTSHNNGNKSYTSDRNKSKGETRARTYQDTYHMPDESQPKPKPRRQQNTRTRKTALNKRCPNRNGKEGWYTRKIKNQQQERKDKDSAQGGCCLLYTSPSPRDKRQSRMPSSA